VASALKPASHRSDTCNKRRLRLVCGWQSSWLGQVAANHSGTKLTQGGFLGFSPCQTAHLVALPAEQTDNPATHGSLSHR
jgi:hypothetical protein